MTVHHALIDHANPTWPSSVDPQADCLVSLKDGPNCHRLLGGALPGCSIMIGDPDSGTPEPPVAPTLGAEGEIWIGGCQVGHGYVKRPEETASQS